MTPYAMRKPSQSAGISNAISPRSGESMSHSVSLLLYSTVTVRMAV